MPASVDYITGPNVFRHVKRQEWGLGRVLSQGPYRRKLMFQDGERRTFKRDYFHLLEEVLLPEPDAKAALDALVADARAEMGAKTRGRSYSAIKPSEAIAAQIEAFLVEYPLAFQDPKWKSEVRGVGATRALKRHRNPVAEKGPAVLGSEALRGHLAADGGAEAFNSMLTILQGTELARIKSDVAPLKALDDAGRKTFLEALVGALEGRPPASYDRFLASLKQLGIKPTWTMISSILTASDPATYGPVRSSTMRKQGKRLNFSAGLSSAPTGEGIMATQSILRAVHEKLTETDLHPVDRLDVADFISKSIAAV